MSHLRLRRILLSSLTIFLLCPPPVMRVLAQTQTARAGAGCDRTGALALVQQQLTEAKGLEQVGARIEILVRAAHLLWTSQTETARAAFKEAYDLAEQDFQKPDPEVHEIKGTKGLAIGLPDQRFVVINAIARHDAPWAKSLAEKVAQAAEEKQGAAEDATSAGRNRYDQMMMGDQFLDLAINLAPVDRAAALNFARSSFRYPASWNGLPAFFYRLAHIDQATADQFYAEALNFYAGRPISELLYLSAYPFALNRFVGPEASSAYTSAPDGFIPSAALQQQFMNTLLGRARRSLQAPQQPVSGSQGLPEAAQLYLALESLEPVIARAQPALVDKVEQMKNALNAIVSTTDRQQLAGLEKEEREIDNPSFNNLTERLEHETVSWKKDYLTAQAVMAGVKTESLERLKGLAEKIQDENVRRQLLNWLYFTSAQKAAKDGLLDDAARLAAKVEEVDQRAYLFFEIAAQAEKKFKDKARVREALDQAAKMALDSPYTNQRARTLLGVAHLYAGLDQFRALEVMGDAVKTINKLEKPDFIFTAVFMQIQGEQFGIYASYPVAGFNLENAFRELAQIDFQGALALARNLESKPLRATTIISIAAPCLEPPSKKRASLGQDRRPMPFLRT